MKRQPSLLIFLGPSCAVLGVLTLIPTLGVTVVSFLQWRGGGSPHGFGLTNFVSLVRDPWFKNSIQVTAIFTFVSAVTEVFLGVLVAICLESLPIMKKALRLVFAVPLLISASTVGIVWKLVLNEQSGPLQLLFRWHLRPLSSPSGAVITLCLVDVWQWTPFVILVISFALEGARSRLGELARSDNLSMLQALVHVWAPLTMPVIGVAALFRTIDCLKAFDVVQTATSGGPGAATEVLSLYAYKQLIAFANFGYTAVLALVLLSVATLAFGALSRAFFRVWER